MLSVRSVKHGLLHEDGELRIPYSEVSQDGVTMKFACDGRMAFKRLETYFAKEPTTLTWIDSFKEDDFLYDVGANVGLYTVYAAAVAGCRVAAFEPESLNYAELNKNIFLNQLHGRVKAYCCAITDRCGLDSLYLSRFAPSYSHHDFGDNRWEGPVRLLVADAASRLPQGCMGLSIDTISDAEWLEQPTHIKVDVDGLEHRVIRGASGMLNGKERRLKTILVEMNFKVKESQSIMADMKAWGWKFSMDQVCTTRHEGKISEAEWTRRAAAGKGGCNIIYFRDDSYHALFAGEPPCPVPA